MKLWKPTRIEEVTKSNLHRHLVNLKVLSTSKGFEALHNVVLDIHGQLLCYDVGMEVGHMYDEIQ